MNNRAKQKKTSNDRADQNYRIHFNSSIDKKVYAGCSFNLNSR
ncbi:MAG: hypothetical protein ACI9E4_001222 [Pseudohongiellaceae bacterium]